MVTIATFPYWAEALENARRGEGRRGFKRGPAGGGRLRRARSGAQSAARQPRHHRRRSGSERSREARSGHTEPSRAEPSRAAGALPSPCSAPRPSGQHEAPASRAAPAAPGALRRTRGRIQVQVLPKGAQDSLQRREEAGNEAKVPALRGEDGYHHHQERVQVPGSGALPTPQAAEHQAVHQVVQRLEREAQGLRRVG